MRASDASLHKYKNTIKQQMKERDLPRICRFCVHAHALYDDQTMLCDKKGVVSCAYSCRKFSYDPLKHAPIQTPPLRVNAEDLLHSLDLDGDEALFPSVAALGEDRDKSSDAPEGKDKAEDTSSPCDKDHGKKKKKKKESAHGEEAAEGDSKEKTDDNGSDTDKNDGGEDKA